MPRGDRRRKGAPTGATRFLAKPCLDLLRAADLIVHAGDFSHPSVLAELRELGPVAAVHGNVDAPELRRELPEEICLDLEDVVLGVIHDAGPARGRLERLRARFPDADAVVFGHSHLPLHERDDGFQIFNPGSPTERRRAPHRSMGEATVRGGSIEFDLVPLP